MKHSVAGGQSNRQWLPRATSWKSVSEGPSIRANGKRKTRDGNAMRIAIRGFAAMVRDAVLRTAPHHEVRMGCDATPTALILRSARSARLEGWPRFGIAALALAF